MRWRDKALLSFLIWIFVYPGVLLVTSAFDWLGINVALWAEIGISTALTVPFITVFAAPLVERTVAASRGETAAELKIAQAREAPGPDPEEITPVVRPKA
ncbi:hypothetical protein [Pararhodobacter sp. SW119]|uniref:hypothetical protein n=1 Tax=Pararhodobacter sp. SW119 TaxID=2780075 RepID=UPI001ADEF5D3|nr:hypothetical protein [Pararhodobacter sp. SW119]